MSTLGRTRTHYGRPQKGFTLLEVLIALAVLAVASAGLLTASSGYLRQSSLLEQQTLARWAAQNRLSELRLAGTPPAVGEQRIRVQLGSQVFELHQQVQSTESPLLLRIQLEVFSEDAASQVSEAYALTRLTAFIRTEL